MQSVAPKAPSSSQLFGHPTGLFILFFTEMWERFSYYGMRAILLLYLLDNVRGGMGMSALEAAAVYGIYTSSVYLLSLPGGWLADNLWGQRRTILYGGIIIMLGHIILAFSTSTGIFYAGLATVAMGTGMLKPNISSIVGELYPEGGARRDAAFSIFYIGINLGSLIGMTIVGYLGQRVGWHIGFGAAAVGMALGILVFQVYGQRYLGSYGNTPEKAEVNPTSTMGNWSGLAFLGGLALMLVILNYTGLINLTSAQGLAQAMGSIIALVALSYFAYILLAGGLTTIEKKRIMVLFTFFLAASLFWAGYEQQGSSLQIFADRYTDLNLFGWLMPSSWIQNLSPAFILIFSPITGILWLWLARKNISFPTPAKFATGLLLLGFGYLAMVFASRLALTGVKVTPLFLVFTYLFHTLGELCLSPVGLSAFAKLSPKRYVSQLMGVWFVATALGNLIAGLFAGGFDAKNVQQMPQLFLSVVYFALGFGLLMLLFARPLKRWMGGIS